MKLKSLIVRRLHDLGPFEIADLATGLNLVVGPNGSGKTSVMQAARAVLWGTPRLGDSDLVTLWDDEKDTWRAELVGGNARWQRGGAEVPAPEVPDAALASSWVVGLADLLAKGDTETRLLERVRRQMSGGYDLAGLVAEHAPRKNAGRAEEKALRAARERLRKIEGERADLVRREDGLDAMRKERDHAVEARREADRLDRALELADVRAQRDAAARRVAGFPAGVETATADAWDRLKEWEDELADARKAIVAAEHEIEGARAAAEAIDLDAPLADADLNAAKAHARDVRDADRDLTDVRKAAAAAQAALESASRALAPDVDPDGAGDVSPDLDAVQAWAEEILQVRAAMAEAEARMGIVQSELDRLGPVPDAAAADARRRADAIPAGIGGGGGGGQLPGWLAGLGVGLLVAGTLLAVLLAPWLAAIAAFGAGLLAGAFVPRGKDDGIEAARSRWAHRAEQLEAERLHYEQTRAAKEAELARLTDRRGELLGGLALDSEPSDLRLADLLRRLGDWRAARRDAAARTAEVEATEARRDEAARALEAALARVGAADLAPAEAEVRIDDLAHRSHALADACRDEAEATRRRDEHAARARDLEERIHGRLAAAGLGEEPVELARARFGELADRHGEWEAAREEAGRLAHRAREIEAELAEHPDLLTLERPALEERRTRALDRANRYDAVRDEITLTESALEKERRSPEYENALADVTAAEEALAGVRDKCLHDAAARLLLDDVRAAHAEQQLPAAFQRARALFSRFTRGRYDLALDGIAGDAPELRAVDQAAAGAGLSLSALSDGTRMQLLLATRVAFATGEEQGRPLPLFLDESLTATDPVRFAAVADAVLALVGEGRQVFYLTSDPADVARWRRACERCASPAPRVVDLAEVRGIAGALDPEALALPPSPEIPAPDGLDAAEYGRRLRVPRFDPHEGGGSVHLFHLLRDDLPLLHRVLTGAQVDRLGPLRSVLALDGAGILDEPERARVEALGRVADAYAKAWRVGRGRPVDRAVLEDSGAVSGKFIDGVSEVAEEVGGRGADLLAAFEAGGDDRLKGFRAAKLEKLESFLREGGYLDPHPPLTAAEILARCRDEVADAIAAGVLDADQVARSVRALDASTARP